MQLTSDLFQNNGDLPALCTCKGQNTSPSLRISDIPAGTVSLALIMHDPDAPGGDFLHWTMWNIDPATSLIEENSVPANARQGSNDFGDAGYGGPCPPSGTHRYVFELFALNTSINAPDGSDRRTVEAALQPHVLSSAKLVGLVSA